MFFFPRVWWNFCVINKNWEEPNRKKFICFPKAIFRDFSIFHFLFHFNSSTNSLLFSFNSLRIFPFSYTAEQFQPQKSFCLLNHKHWEASRRSFSLKSLKKFFSSSSSHRCICTHHNLFFPEAKWCIVEVKAHILWVGRKLMCCYVKNLYVFRLFAIVVIFIICFLPSFLKFLCILWVMSSWRMCFLPLSVDSRSFHPAVLLALFIYVWLFKRILFAWFTFHELHTYYLWKRKIVSELCQKFLQRLNEKSENFV